MVKNQSVRWRRLRRLGSVSGSGRSPEGGHGNLPVFLPGKPHGQRSLGATVHGVAESDTTE